MAASVELLAKAMRGNGVEPIQLIGQGGMGAVYKAWQWNPNRIASVESHAAAGRRWWYHQPAFSPF